MLSSFSHPTKQLRRVEKAIATVNQSRRRAVFELQITRVASFVLARFIPDARHGADAAHHAATDEPHDIDVMWSLVQDDTAAGGQLMPHPRPVHEFVVVPGIDHAKLA